MPLLPLALPPGVHANGTPLQSAGRWRDASLVRWANGSMGPIGGWTARAQVTAGTPRAALSWRTLAGDHLYAVGTPDAMLAVSSDNTVTDITPAGLVTGTTDAEVNTGYGKGTYGTSYYGVPRPAYGNFDEATTWALDTWGEELIACSVKDGRIWAWDLDATANLVAVPNAPTGCLSAVVTDERFLMALGADSNPRKVQWSDREDRETWAPLPENEAGDFELATAGQIMCAVKVPGRTLILTDRDAHAATYLGPPFVYGFTRAGDACGVISRKAACAVGARAFWMGNNGFFQWDGASVQPLPCDIADDVFGRLNAAQESKTWAVANSAHDEVWFFFAEGNEIDSYAAFNYREGHWAKGSLARTAGFDRGVFRSPMWFRADGWAVDHETGLNHDGGEVFAASAPIQIGQGDEVMSVTKLIADELTEGDVTVRFGTRFDPTGTDYSFGPYTLTGSTDVRFTGRQVAMRVTGARLAAWRWGVPRIEARGNGRR